MQAITMESGTRAASSLAKPEGLRGVGHAQSFQTAFENVAKLATVQSGGETPVPGAVVAQPKSGARSAAEAPAATSPDAAAANEAAGEASTHLAQLAQPVGSKEVAGDAGKLLAVVGTPGPALDSTAGLRPARKGVVIEAKAARKSAGSDDVVADEKASNAAGAAGCMTQPLAACAAPLAAVTGADRGLSSKAEARPGGVAVDKPMGKVAVGSGRHEVAEKTDGKALERDARATPAALPSVAAAMDAGAAQDRAGVKPSMESHEFKAASGVVTTVPTTARAHSPEANAAVRGAQIVAQPRAEVLGAALEPGVSAAGEHRFMSATSTVLEVGMQGTDHGWLTIRAERSGDGVAAALVATSAARAETLHHQVSAISAYLETEHIAMTSLVVGHADAAVAAQTGREEGAGQTGGGREPQPREEGARNGRDQARSDGRPGAAMSAGGSGDLGLPGWLPAMSTGAGSWLNVLA